ncbi:LPXTG cell wall anchor domain-containing protein, partial [Streptomyces sp. S6]
PPTGNDQPPGGGDTHGQPPTGNDQPPGGGDTNGQPPTGNDQPPGGDTNGQPPTGNDQPPAGHPAQPPVLAHTGSSDLLAAAGFSAAMIAGGAVLYRRGRAATRR